MNKNGLSSWTFRGATSRHDHGKVNGNCSMMCFGQLMANAHVAMNSDYACPHARASRRGSKEKRARAEAEKKEEDAKYAWLLGTGSEAATATCAASLSAV